MPQHFQTWSAYQLFAREVKANYRFLHEEKVRQFLNAVAETAVSRCQVISADRPLWRAQVGYSPREFDVQGDIIEEPYPFAAERMKPRRGEAVEGRANPRGIPYLYTASDTLTAISEVRPSLGDFVTVARLLPQRDLRVVVCVDGHDDVELPPFEAVDAAECERRVWKDIGRAFSRPASAAPGIAEYVPTQVLAEHFRQLKYDGIGYKSKLGPEFNVVIFDIDLLTVVHRELHTVEGVTYKSEPYESLSFVSTPPETRGGEDGND